MNKSLKLGTSLLLTLLLIASCVLPVFAAEVDPTELNLLTVQDFEDFASNCMLDSYSENMIVNLKADLDLSHTDFTGVPIFSGTFEGNGHTISGLHLTGEGSVQGLFRYLAEGATVQNLTVKGEVLPEGSRETVGGLAGCNSGTVVNCVFVGEVSGTDYVGGLVGTNQVSGIVENCKVLGNVHGNHFIGGLVGENYGTVRSCENSAAINTTATENSVELSEITTGTLTGTESADTVTDVGGIAGTNTGVIRGCVNRGTVGYQHMGYNIGGIAGSQRGYITESENYGEVYGRKEIAGIVGQMEPVSNIQYSADTLQILRRQLATTSALANQASSNAHNNAASLNGQMNALHNQAETALDAVHQLIPGGIPDSDAAQAAKNSLSSSLSSMQSTILSMNSTAQSGASTAAQDIRSITNQINAISGTLDSAAENLGGTITDISDADKADDLSGKVSACTNFGAVSGDLNVGGITGAVAWENDLDPEDDFTISGNQSLNFDSELRAVILDCRNQGLITAKKRNVGGIAGNQAMGLVKNCVNTGSVQAEDADYVGGISGTGSGYLRSCSAKCELWGSTYVGGIVGSAPVVTDCRSMVILHEGKEKLGAVLGIATQSDGEEEQPIRGNYYLQVNPGLGAIDGISYDGAAQSLPEQDFLSLPDLPQVFTTATMTFLFEDGHKQELTVPVGQVVDAGDIPQLPAKEGYTARWDRLAETDLNSVYFDVLMNAEYVPCRTVVQSEQLRPDGKPVMLAEGKFETLETLNLEPLELTDRLAFGVSAVESWKLTDFGTDGETKIRLNLAEGLETAPIKAMVQGPDGAWREVPYGVDGSYLVFRVQADDQAVSIGDGSGLRELYVFLGVLGTAAAALLIVHLVKKQLGKRKKPQQNTEENPTGEHEHETI